MRIIFAALLAAITTTATAQSPKVVLRDGVFSNDSFIEIFHKEVTFAVRDRKTGRLFWGNFWRVRKTTNRYRLWVGLYEITSTQPLRVTRRCIKQVNMVLGKTFAVSCRDLKAEIQLVDFPIAEGTAKNERFWTGYGPKYAKFNLKGG